MTITIIVIIIAIKSLLLSEKPLALQRFLVLIKAFLTMYIIIFTKTGIIFNAPLTIKAIAENAAFIIVEPRFCETLSPTALSIIMHPTNSTMHGISKCIALNAKLPTAFVKIIKITKTIFFPLEVNFIYVNTSWCYLGN